MNLSTLFFVFAFLPVSLILYLLCPRVCKNALLILVSFLFYAWGSPVYLLLLLLVTVFNYCIGRDIGNRVESEQRGAKFVLVFGVLFNLLLLGFYKYTDFAIETLNAFLPFTLNAPSPALPLAFPSSPSRICPTFRTFITAAHPRRKIRWISAYMSASSRK